MEIKREVNIDVTYDGQTYQMDIAPILNAILAFLTNLLKTYLPEEFEEIM